MIGLMVALVVMVLCIGLVLVTILGVLTNPGRSSKANRRAEVERADWRLHQLAGSAFQAMLDEARRRRSGL